MILDEQKNKRIDEIDVLKGIGILLMILDHCFGWGESVFLHSVIQSFHMPLFFIVSGYLWKPRNELKDYIYHKIKTILVPWINFCVIYAFVFVGLYTLGKMTGKDTTKSIIALFTFSTRSDLTKFASPIWFLQALFIVEILFTVLKEKIDRHYAWIIILIVICGITYSEKSSFMLPFALEPISTGIAFFVIGHKIKKIQKIWLDNKNYWVLFPMIFLWIVFVVLNGCVDMRSARYYNPIFYITNGVLGTLIVWNISRIISSHLKIIAVIKYFSIYSITYLCTHYIFVYYGSRVFRKLLPLPNDIIKIFLFVCVLMICWVINKLIMKYIPWLVGVKSMTYM